MSLIITLYVPEGLVIAGDSRLSLSWKTPITNGENLHTVTASDSNTKIFTIKNKFGLGDFGAADINGVPISGFINQFIEEMVKDDTEIDQMPQLLLDFFGEKFGYPATQFYTIGYKIENGISTPYAYIINISGKSFNRVNFGNGQTFNGANWGGEIEILSRILNSVQLKQGDKWIELPDIPVIWNFMTLQDAIDFAVYAIRTTIETLRFQQKEKTVGGPIDILVIRPNEPPRWIKHKDLRSE